LDDTARKYLYFTQPLVSEEAHAHTKELVGNFVQEIERADAALRFFDAHNKHTNYISEMWYDMYLENRDSFPLNLTPQLTWKMDENPAKNEQAVRAADITHAAVRFWRTMTDGRLKPDVFHTKPHLTETTWFQHALGQLVPRSVAFYGAAAAGAYPLDMSQYGRLFNSTRIPKEGKDELVTFRNSRHVAVMRGNKVWKLPVLDETLQPLPVESIEAGIRGILADSGCRDGLPVGALTGMNRDEWAEVRRGMEVNPTNASALADVDAAMFVLTLDDTAPEGHEEVSRVMLHGEGTDRWFDKSFNIMVSANGRSGIAWEHAWGDGVAVLRFFNEVYDAISAAPARSHASACAPSEIVFDTAHSAVSGAIRKATSDLSRQFKECELKVYQSDSLLRADIKKARLSPDGLMQMVLQLAHHRMHGYTPSTYESGSTAAFKHGRTEVIRSATPEAVSFCQAFSDADAPATAKLAALRTAVDNHSAITRDAVMGLGVDRHLFALEHWAKKLGMDVPALYGDETYGVFKDIRLSTSTLASPALEGGGFGPVSRTSYGVGYGIAEEGCQFHVTSYGLGSAEFCSALEASLRDVKQVIDDALAE
jgi:carnitine O-palmitoyltransferase 2